MREIKFRVFDKDLKRMHICGEDVHDSISFINNQACYYNLQNGCGSLPKELGEGTYEIMQFTGLKDKNGKEIYEGDVLSAFYGTQLTEVYWNSKFGLYEIVLQISGVTVPSGELLGNHLSVIEVIGNIYENPELLKG
jgi:uncharacterized phage protein (TIGR01671 family)